jgi:hypothetical protein
MIKKNEKIFFKMRSCYDKNWLIKKNLNKTVYLLAMIRTNNLLIVNPILYHIANKKQLEMFTFLANINKQNLIKTLAYPTIPRSASYFIRKKYENIFRK